MRYNVREGLKGVERMKQKVLCNCCGRALATSDSGKTVTEDAVYIRKEWGYFSGQDGTNLSADVCEKCLMDWIQTFRHKPDMSERVII